ncbi:hypothetical protein GGQ84_002046 [Desulfitispora alkaliphila]|uniref:hypothetical protein n=1 Tax=Desulfitispora alkaliphila TaxID=622674 RepID=UPI003D24E972
MHLLFYIFIFFFIFNLDVITDRFSGKKTTKSPYEAFLLPVILGLLLAMVNSLRIFFVYQLIIFIILALVVYLGFIKIKKKYL